MRSDRPLSALLFAIAGAPGWFDAAKALGGFSVLELTLATLAGAVSCGAAGALAGKALGTEARSGTSSVKGAVLGVFVTALGALIGGSVLGVAAAGLSRSLPEAVVITPVIILVSVLPWLTLGAVAGAVFYQLQRSPVRGAV
jgi:CDP-diglyceride synthetase